MSDEMITTSSFQDKKFEECIIKKEDNIEESLVVGEEIVVDTNGYLPNKLKTNTTMYFEENLETYDKVAADYKDSIDGVSVPLTESLIDDKWTCETMSESWRELEMEQQESDEETIATFVTAAGTQLALYAVEDSDEIFAVSVYNESGEPPNDFQFLMKADVERLIGEGAVRTVKKPSQMKKRLITTQPPVFYRKGNFEEVYEQANDNIFTHDTSINSDEKNVVQEEDYEIIHTYKSQNYNDSGKINSMSSDKHITDEQSDITYFMMDNNSVNIAEQSDENQENGEFENELVERSTVQYILLEDDHQSDSELTFDDIQTTLRNLKTSRERALEKGNDPKSKLRDDESSSSFSRNLHDSSTSIEPSNEDLDELDLYMSPIRNRVTEDDRQRLIDTLTDSPPPSTTPTMMAASTSQLKVKRSRKQQLISVNRDDGEIIIQPASMLSEEELDDKKRGKRRRRLSSTQMHVAISPNSKRIKRKKRREVEVIDLDVDEEERQPKSNVVEITLDDSKDKYSSDKENEIIMVRDSDSDNRDDEDDDDDNDDDDDERSSDDLAKLNGVMRCEHCSRNFRQRRTFDAHLRICQKSPANALRFVERKDKEKGQKVRKQYACKICQEKFDEVMALARHVRITHHPRKKQRTQEKSWSSQEATSEEKEELNDDDTSKSELDMLTRVKRRRRRKGNSSWETKKLNCGDCNRWFPSLALLNAHSLQHGTKKSEQLRRCHVCKKLIKSRMQFLQHLKLHSDTQRMLRRRLRTRPSTTPRKRGRPRKL
ncbi:probable serine/threonine-protein kinase fhkB isoform X2 [Nylanderia fulva]|nr:probable serine/threonine-protein kinase fhkB isoform X2 [Nylanderia fulva]XP_029176901.1 probable serine/threonine-protein kinase fhkB isoform X2 [Nylanderia fulva]